MKPTKMSLDLEEPIEQINTKEIELPSNASVVQSIQSTVVQTPNSALDTVKFDTPNSNILSETIQQANNGFNVAGMTIDTLNLLQLQKKLQNPVPKSTDSGLSGLLQSDFMPRPQLKSRKSTTT